MKNYRKSDYAVNKYAKGIVYKFTDRTVSVTQGEYLRENPGSKDTDFAELKELSDRIYLEQDRSDTRQRRKNISFEEMKDTRFCATLSLEEDFFEKELQRERKKILKEVLSLLTEVQRRRYLLHIVEGLSSWKIAEKEGVSQSSVMECLAAADRKIKTFCGQAENTRSKAWKNDVM